MRLLILITSLITMLLIGTNCSDVKRDKKLMEQEVLKAGRDFNELMKKMKSGRSYEELVKSGDLKKYNQFLADEYTYTSRDGKLSGKADDLESFKATLPVIQSAEFLDQKVRVVDINTAVETGMIRYIGTNNGNPFDITKRYTTTWIYRDGRWQIVADHTSKVEE